MSQRPPHCSPCCSPPSSHPPAAREAGHSPTHCPWQASPAPTRPMTHPTTSGPFRLARYRPGPVPHMLPLFVITCLSCALLVLAFLMGPAHPSGLSLPWKPPLSSWLDRVGFLSSVPPLMTAGPSKVVLCLVHTWTPGSGHKARTWLRAKYTLAQDRGTGYEMIRQAIAQHSTDPDQPVIVPGLQSLSLQGWQHFWQAFDEEKLPT